MTFGFTILSNARSKSSGSSDAPIARAIGAVHLNCTPAGMDMPAMRWNPVSCAMEPNGLPSWKDYLREADAALAAMTEPTEAMVKAGEDAWTDGETKDIYQAMIGAAGYE